MSEIEKIKVFCMQNLLLECDLARIEESGIEIHHIETLQSDDVVDVDLFENEIYNEAKRMSKFYILYYSIENSIRKLITDRMIEECGANWWDEKVPENLKIEVKKRQEKERDSVMSIRSDDPLTYTTFGELIVIFNSNWEYFDDILRSQKAMQDVLTQLNRLRGVIAHSCEINEDEMKRFELHIKDWLRIQS